MSGVTLFTFYVHFDVVNAIAWSLDGALIASASRDRICKFGSRDSLRGAWAYSGAAYRPSDGAAKSIYSQLMSCNNLDRYHLLVQRHAINPFSTKGSCVIQDQNPSHRCRSAEASWRGVHLRRAFTLGRWHDSLPEFTTRRQDRLTVCWEHPEMLDNAGYRSGWEVKRAWYAERAFLCWTESDGARGILVWSTKKQDTGGFGSQQIVEFARQVLR